MTQQQQQYMQYTPQPASSYPGATVYAYPGSQQAQVIQVQPGVQTTIISQNKYNPAGQRAAIVLGIIQLVIGCACIGCQTVSWIFEVRTGRIFTLEYMGTGIWCGALFLLTGILGICASKRNTQGLIIAFMVFNIFSSLAIWALLSFAAVNVIWINRCQTGEFYIWSLTSEDGSLACTDILYTIWGGMNYFLVALALVEFGIALRSAVYCCKAVCTCCRSNAGLIVQQPPSGVYLPTTTAQQQQQQQLLQHQVPMEQLHGQQQQQPYDAQAPPLEGKIYPNVSDHLQTSGDGMAKAVP